MRSLYLMRDTDDAPATAEPPRIEPLMASIKGGSSTALGQLMDLYWPELVRYASSQLRDVELARDVVQEAFIQIWERRRAWRPRGSARAYLYRIVRHQVIDEKRKMGVRKRWLERQEHVDAPRPATPAEVLEAKILADAFERAVASLPERRREVFELVFQRGLGHAEAASVIGVSVPTVANQMSAALRTVRRAVKEI